MPRRAQHYARDSEGVFLTITLSKQELHVSIVQHVTIKFLVCKGVEPDEVFHILHAQFGSELFRRLTCTNGISFSVKVKKKVTSLKHVVSEVALCHRTLFKFKSLFTAIDE